MVQRLVIGPQEKRDQHVKVYVEPSVYRAIKNHQNARGFYSFSETVRDLLIHALDAEVPADDP